MLSTTLDNISESCLGINSNHHIPYCAIRNIYRLIHEHFHIGLVIIPRPPYWPETQSRANMGRGMITRPIWKCVTFPCSILVQ